MFHRNILIRGLLWYVATLVNPDGSRYLVFDVVATPALLVMPPPTQILPFTYRSLLPRRQPRPRVAVRLSCVVGGEAVPGGPVCILPARRAGSPLHVESPRNHFLEYDYKNGPGGNRTPDLRVANAALCS